MMASDASYSDNPPASFSERHSRIMIIRLEYCVELPIPPLFRARKWAGLGRSEERSGPPVCYHASALTCLSADIQLRGNPTSATRLGKFSCC